jgi:phosphatidylserine/phosphatidylglycerophosphate/cardiolipin synthase-like enzyme
MTRVVVSNPSVIYACYFFSCGSIFDADAGSILKADRHAFTDAARRGVDVKIILPSTSDSSLAQDAMWYNYSELLRAGVKIYEYRNAWLHAKTAVIDGVWSTVGSTKLDTGALQGLTK